ncbi:hypothetical protein LTR66_013535 [Elasticomyces elasticus]|nr:hypothetical protein LTR66_013535 [Elasticomyces elasticus]
MICFVTQDFVDGGSYNDVAFQANDLFSDRAIALSAIGALQKDLSAFERLENADYISAYATNFLSSRRTLAIVTSNTTATIAVETSNTTITSSYPTRVNMTAEGVLGLWGSASWDPSSTGDFHRTLWYNYTVKICSGAGMEDHNGDGYCYEKLPSLIAHAQEWQPGDFDVKYCLSQRNEQNCAYEANLLIVLIVAICNLGKVVGMFYVVFGIRDSPLITVGDAVQSFMDEPDDSIKGMGLTSKRDITAQKAWSRMATTKPWKPDTPRWYAAASVRRWTICVSSFGAAIIVVSTLLIYAAAQIANTSANSLFSFGFGAVNSQTLITGWAITENIRYPSVALIASVLMANLPQLILSVLYFNLNGLFTTLFLADEWSRFAYERKGLRVSLPRSGSQRKTFFLQLPYRIGIPLLVISGLLHWLVSQSIFLAVVDEFITEHETGFLNGQLAPMALVTCGYSPLAMILVIAVGLVLIVFTLSFGLRRYKPGAPLVGSCSAAISAACHYHKDVCQSDDAATRPLMWGVVVEGNSDDDADAGHCCFTDKSVTFPVEGHKYAGLRDLKRGPALQ